MDPALKASHGSHVAPHFPSNREGVNFKTGLLIQMSDRRRGWPEFEDNVQEVSKETFEFLVLATHA